MPRPPRRPAAPLLRPLLLAALIWPGIAAAQKPDTVTPLPSPRVELPRLTPARPAADGGPNPQVLFQPWPTVAPPLSPPSAAAATAAATPPAPASPPPSGPPSPTAPHPGQGAAPKTVWTAATVRLRAAPDRGARVLDELDPGARLEVLDTLSGGWLKVGRNGRPLGFVAADFVTDRSAKAEPARTDVSKTEPPKRYAKASREDNGCALPGSLPSSAARRPMLPAGTVARVLADANLRVAPACDAKVLDVLDAGGTVTILDGGGSWYRVGRKGKVLGYVGAALLGESRRR
ncbi:SH3 domain-containing protein [Azospirillum thermophilum]|nr:SH3 domain-containing protein [Azospirillum thermophilum]